MAVRFVLLEAAGDGEEEHDVPRDADLGPHFQVDISDAGIQAGAHKKVINEAPGHTHRFSGDNGGKVHEVGHKPTPKHSNGHEVAEVVDDTGQAEDVEVV